MFAYAKEVWETSKPSKGGAEKLERVEVNSVFCCILPINILYIQLLLKEIV